jgi:hypothetical protein
LKNSQDYFSVSIKKGQGSRTKVQGERVKGQGTRFKDQGAEQKTKPQYSCILRNNDIIEIHIPYN